MPYANLIDADMRLTCFCGWQTGKKEGGDWDEEMN